MDNVRAACIRLIEELGIESNLSNPYWHPYTNYVMSWQFHLPINTIIIGQNPYPQRIYPEFGAAFAYDDRKCRTPPGSIQVMAYDLFNYDETDKDLTIECFKNSWRLLEAGVLMINETVFDKISNGNKSNTRAIKEMESQMRALQIVISESILMDQSSITCIGMGIPAAQMSSIVRSWSPKDLVSCKTITCSNPAAIARDLGDLPSHLITIGKRPVSKVLANIVQAYAKMPPPKATQGDRRRQQNIDALKKAADEVKNSGTIYESELKSLEERFRSVNGSATVQATLPQLADSLGSLRKAVNSHRNALSAHHVSMLMVIESMPRSQQSGTEVSISVMPNTPVTPTTPLSAPRGPRRRTTIRTTSTPNVQSIEETDEAIVEQNISGTVSPAPSVAPSAVPSRARRRPRVSMTPSYAPSAADTEYTVDSVATHTETAEHSLSMMNQLEAMSIESFAEWCLKNITAARNDPTFEEILRSAVATKSAPNALSKNVLAYVRMRRDADRQYDAYDELDNPESESSKWISENIPSSI